MDPEQVRAWVAGRRAAARRQVEERRRHRPSAAEAFERAMALVELAESVHGWPLPKRDVDRAEQMAVYELWGRLRRSAT